MNRPLLSRCLPLLLAVIPFALPAQQPGMSRHTLQRFVEEYIQHSRLGPGYSRDMSAETAERFTALFRRDALLCWDLYANSRDSLRVPLTPAEYIGLATRQYHNRQPVLDYPEKYIRIRTGHRNAVAHLRKTNLLMDADDHPTGRNTCDLRLEINLAGNQPVITHITAVEKSSPFRAAVAALNIMPWNNVTASLRNDPSVTLPPNESFMALSITSRCLFQWEANAVFRLFPSWEKELLLTTGISYSYRPLWSAMQDYVKSYPDTVTGQDGKSLALTTFERAPDVGETMEYERFEIPVTIGSPITAWSYFRAGLSVGFIRGTTTASYYLSKTGGGDVTDLSSGQHYYLDPGQELDGAEYGYYRNRKFSYSFQAEAGRMFLSVMVAAGVEKRFGHFCLGAEPNILFGMNPLVVRHPVNDYTLGDPAGFHSILESVVMPEIEFTPGIRIRVCYSL